MQIKLTCHRFLDKIPTDKQDGAPFLVIFVNERGRLSYSMMNWSAEHIAFCDDDTFYNDGNLMWAELPEHK